MLAVGFALEETLATEDGAERAAFADVAAQIAVEMRRAIAPELIGAAFERVQSSVRSGRMLPEAAAQQSFAELFLGGDLPVDCGARYRVAAARLTPKTTRALEGADVAFARLGELSLPHAILTNGWYGRARKIAETIGFAGPVVVPNPADWKPASKAFEALARVFGLPASRVWYVGTDPHVDIAGAVAAGMPAIWVNRDGREYPPHLPAPTAEVATLPDIFDVLREPYTRAALTLRELLLSKY